MMVLSWRLSCELDLVGGSFSENRVEFGIQINSNNLMFSYRLFGLLCPYLLHRQIIHAEKV